MKKYVTIFCIVSSLIIVLGSFNFGYALAMFFFAGIVPIINIQLSPNQMLLLYAAAIIFIVVSFKPRILHRFNSVIAKQNHSKPRKLKHV
jgi:hypothetical protein